MRTPSPISARRSLLSGLGAAVAAWGAGATRVAAQSAVAGFEPARHPQDAWLAQVPGRHRTIIDCASVNGAGEGLFFANNILEANRTGYQLADRDVAVVVCLRHFATVFAYNDAMWAKYGTAIAEGVKFTDPNTKAAPTVNLMNASDAQLSNMGVTIAELVQRGVQFAVCGMATRGSAAIVAKATKGDADAIYQELVANLVPNSHLVAAGVVGINRAQEYGYTLLTTV